MMNRALIALPGAALAIGLLYGAPAQATAVSSAESVTVTNASMTWPISACAFDVRLPACTSLTERQELSGDVTRGETGWVFAGGDGTVTEAGDMTVSWDATVQLGNANRGNYSITFIDPVLSVDAAGAGAITAAVATQIGAEAPVVTENVTVVEFTGGSTDADVDSTPLEFAESLVDALSGASGSGFNLASWFTQTGSASDPLKFPGVVAFDRWVPTLTVTLPKKFENKNPRVKNKRFKVTVKGTGFDPAAKENPAVQGLYVVFGPDAGTTEGGYRNMDMYFRARYLPIAPDGAGEFTTRLQVRGKFTKDGVSYDGRFGEPLGVSTWAAHSHATTAWDAFEQIRFRK